MLLRTVVFWDFGGVITTSPFDNFRRVEQELGAPVDFIRQINAQNPDTNAWAQLERDQITGEEFGPIFAKESAQMGFEINGIKVLEALKTTPRPFMIDCLRIIKAAGLRQFCLTNNISGDEQTPGSSRHVDIQEAMSQFDGIVESSKVGVRKPEDGFYRLALEQAGATPEQVVFLDDLGINLKPAAAMGMATIKVVHPHAALCQLQEQLGLAIDLQPCIDAAARLAA